MVRVFFISAIKLLLIHPRCDSKRLLHSFTIKTSNWTPILAFIRKEMVMKMEKMNIPPNPYRCSVRRPVLSISGMETSVITTLRQRDVISIADLLRCTISFVKYLPWCSQSLLLRTLRSPPSDRNSWRVKWNNKIPDDDSREKRERETGTPLSHISPLNNNKRREKSTSSALFWFHSVPQQEHPLTALMPLSCWLNCITIPIISGARNVGEQINSIIEMLLSDCCARSSARISSMSSSTWLEARNRLRAIKRSGFYVNFLYHDDENCDVDLWKVHSELEKSFSHLCLPTFSCLLLPLLCDQQISRRFGTNRQQYQLQNSWTYC